MEDRICKFLIPFRFQLHNAVLESFKMKVELLIKKRKESYWDRKRVEELAIILCLWNGKKKASDEALMEITELFKPEYLDFWKEYSSKDLLRWAKKINFVRYPEKEGKKDE